ncbi:hypothetical protein FGO68_gene5048 [Halteria grandinella]|uniref:Autophagy protein ATG17-like domain-containing protein n=1 Tax=Halteria grandinella TaxID=5974 RepID=A0A8J8NZA8_HALGN|nr:hypothetical protein FGO68_gene5048 [Halteria grandinella]
MSNHAEGATSTGSSQTPFQNLRKNTLIAYQKVSEALKECSLLIKGLENQVEGTVQVAQAKLERIDAELNGQFNIIQVLVGSLHSKKVDAKVQYDKVEAASNCQNTLQQILNSLSECEIAGNTTVQDQQLGKAKAHNQSDGLKAPDKKGADNMTSSVHEELKQRGIHTLWDFVDEESIREVTGRAEITYQQLQIVYQRYAEHVESLVRKVDAHLSKIVKAKGDCSLQRGAVLEKQQRIRILIAEVHKLFRTVEIAYQQLESLAKQSASPNISQESNTRSNQQLNQIVAQSEALMEELGNESELIKTSIEGYRLKNEQAREAFVSFVNFAPQVQLYMQEVDKWQNQFELKRQQSIEDFEEVEKLRTWYEYFQKSYIQMESEIERRRKFEAKLRLQVQAMQSFLESELAAEHRVRIEFNEQNHRYLPQNLKVMLEEPPTQYQIYPTILDHEETQILDYEKLPESTKPVVGGGGDTSTKTSEEEERNQRINNQRK